MKIINRILLTSVSSAVLLSTPIAANAAGFYLQEQSVSGLGSAYAGSAAMPRDASVIFYNPAGITHLEGTNVNVGVHIIMPDSDITDTGSTLAGAAISGGDGGNPYSPTALPNGYISHQVTDDFWVGVGISAPFGLANDYGSNWFGRYDSTESELATIDVTPTAAYRVNDWLSVGGSLIVEYAHADLRNSLNAGTEGQQTLEGKDVSFGYNLGVLVEPLEGTRIGVDYRSQINHELDGSLVIVGSTGGDINTSGKAGLHLPDIATFSAAQDINDKWTLLGTATWFGWNSFEDIQVSLPSGATLSPVVQNYQTTWAYAIGAEYMMDDQWTFRAGYQFDETPTTDEYRTTRTPDGDRHWFTLGATYNLDDQWSFDMGAAYIDIEEEDINLTRNVAAIPAVVSAESDGYVGILSLGINYKF